MPRRCVSHQTGPVESVENTGGAHAAGERRPAQSERSREMTNARLTRVRLLGLVDSSPEVTRRVYAHLMRKQAAAQVESAT